MIMEIIPEFVRVQTLRAWEWVRRKTWRLTAMFLSIWFGGIVGFIMAKFLLCWILYAPLWLTLSVVDFGEGYLSEYAPPDVGSEWRRLRRKVAREPEPYWVGGIKLPTLPSFDSRIASDWGATVGGTVMCLFALYIMTTPLRRVTRRSIHWVRGVKYEAMREGSEFTKKDIPKFQVAIKFPGLLNDTHSGFGIRVGNQLVTLRHVIQDYQQIILERAGRKCLVDVKQAIDTRLVQDVVYIDLPEKVWSMLGVTSARLASKFRPMTVSCTGMDGCSTGHLRKRVIKGTLTYMGSTVPGMSGAAYVSIGAGEEVVGMHQGVTGHHNFGPAAAVFAVELSEIYKGESSEDVAQAASRFISEDITKKVAMWELDDLRSQANKTWADPDYEVDYSAQIDFGESAKPKIKLPASILVDPGTSVKVSNHSDTPTETTYRVLTETRDVEDVEARRAILNLTNRLEALEKKLQPKPKISCDQCDVTCNGEAALENHRKSAHILVHVCKCGKKTKTQEARDLHQSVCTFRAESAVDCDTGAIGKVVKEATFLGKRPNSPRRKNKTSSKSSNSSRKTTRSPSPAENQSEVRESLTNIANLLKGLVQRMDGQNLATTQK